MIIKQPIHHSPSSDGQANGDGAINNKQETDSLQGVPLEDGEQIKDSFKNLKLILDDDVEGETDVYQNTSMYVTNKSICFVTEKISIKVPIIDIIAHGISNFEEEPCLYAQLDVGEDNLYEMRILYKAEKDGDTPSKEVISSIYKSLSYAASLNPDQNEDEEDDDMIYNEELVRKSLSVHSLSDGDDENDDKNGPSSAKKQKKL